MTLAIRVAAWRFLSQGTIRACSPPAKLVSWLPKLPLSFWISDFSSYHQPFSIDITRLAQPPNNNLPSFLTNTYPFHLSITSLLPPSLLPFFPPPFFPLRIPLSPPLSFPREFLDSLLPRVLLNPVLPSASLGRSSSIFVFFHLASFGAALALSPPVSIRQPKNVPLPFEQPAQARRRDPAVPAPTLDPGQGNFEDFPPHNQWASIRFAPPCVSYPPALAQ